MNRCWLFLCFLTLASLAQASDAQIRLFEVERRSGINYEWWATADRLRRTPKWDPSKGDPPIPLRKAVQIASKWLADIDGVTVAGTVDTILVGSLHNEAGDFRNVFFYRIDFVPRQFDHMSCIILMDGTVVEPKKLIPGGSAGDDPQRTNRGTLLQQAPRTPPADATTRDSGNETHKRKLGPNAISPRDDASSPEALVGIWKSEEFASNMPEFSGVTNITLAVLGFFQISTNRQTGTAHAYVNAKLRMIDRDGRDLPAPDSSPVELEGERITFGIPPNGYSFRFTLQADSLVLERKSSHEYLRTRLLRNLDQ